MGREEKYLERKEKRKREDKARVERKHLWFLWRKKEGKGRGDRGGRRVGIRGN